MSQFFTSGGQSIGTSASASVLPRRKKVALFLCQAKREHGSFAPRELCPLPWGVGRGLIVRTMVRGMW